MKQGIDDPFTERIIGLAIAVHRELGPGFLESIYEEAMAIAMTQNALRFQRQFALPVLFRDRRVGEHRLDFSSKTPSFWNSKPSKLSRTFTSQS